jgi:hypothetical protein
VDDLSWGGRVIDCHPCPHIMARRNNSGMKKLQPSVLTFMFNGETVTAGGNVSQTIDLSQVASICNRRFYRQGLNWAVGGFKILSTAQLGFVTVQKLPNTWIMSNAWHKSFATWTKMNREAMEETPSVRPRFLDFKVYADSIHHTAGFVGNMLPISVGSTATPGEWSPSKVYVPIASTLTPAPGQPDMQDYELIATGASYPGISAVTGLNAVSLIEGYAASRGLPNVLDPNVPVDAADVAGLNPENWMTAIFNEGETTSHEVIEDMISENNIAPYPFENGEDTMQFLPSGLPNPNFGLPFTDTMYPGGANQLIGLEIHSSDYITGTTIGGTTRIRGGNFPCGLIRIAVSNSDPSESLSWTLQIEMIPGTHRGYLAESMQDM